MIGNKVVHKINSVSKTKSKKREDETNKIKEIYISPGKRQQIIDDLRLFEHHIKMEYQENYKVTTYNI